MITYVENELHYTYIELELPKLHSLEMIHIKIRDLHVLKGQNTEKENDKMKGL
jgi:hypothetical protein